VTLAVRNTENGQVSVRITDTGCGMTTEEVERIFNPEYTTKEKGLGLGLPSPTRSSAGMGGDPRPEPEGGRNDLRDPAPCEEARQRQGAKTE